MLKKMNTSQTGYSIGQARSWEDEINLDSPGESEWIIIPEKINIITVTISFSAGASGKVQISTDKIDTIENGIPIAVDWPFGVVSTNQSKSCRPVAGMRAVQVGTGTMKMTLRAQ